MRRSKPLCTLLLALLLLTCAGGKTGSCRATGQRCGCGHKVYLYHSLVVTIPSRAKVEMVRKTNSLSGVRITDTIARGKVIGVNEGVVTVKPMVSRTNVAKLQSLASTNTMVGVNAIENKMKTFG